MKISVFGLGYVGSVTAACFAEKGHQVIGVEANPTKVEWIRQGQPPVLEAKLDEMMKRLVGSGQLTATTDVQEAIMNSELSLVCVGTPSKSNGDLDLQYVSRVAQQIGAALAKKSSHHTVVLRSTVLPGTTLGIVKPILEEHSGKREGKDFSLLFNPEFLREGTAVADFHHPPFTVVGTASGEAPTAIHDLYGWLDAELLVVDIPLAETIKYINNCFHALKVAFANEVGRICAALQVDSHRLMEIFCKDTKQNLSSYYFKPGFSFGGSCLPKDLRAMLYLAKSLDVPLEVFRATLESNRTQTEIGVSLVEQAGKKRVGLLGLSFKAGTDDLRESPLVSLAETLHGRGYQVRIYDEHVHLSRLIGANKSYVEQQLPHLGALLCNDLAELIDHSETLIIGNGNPMFKDVLAKLPEEKRVIDLVRISRESIPTAAQYRGIGW